MKRIFYIFPTAAALCAAVMACSCGKGGENGENKDTNVQNVSENDSTLNGGYDENGEYVFTDSTGVKVSVPKNPEKVAVLMASYADLWQLAGGTVSVTIEGSVDRGYVKEDEVTIVGDNAGKTIDSEALLASEPDFVILTTDISGQMELVDLLRENNIPVAAMTEDSFEDYLNILKIFTDITGNKQAYEKYGTALEKRVEEIKKKITEADGASPKILLVRAFSTGAKAKTDDNFVGMMLDELGCDNIAKHAEVLLDELSAEAIAVENPEYVFVTTMGNDTDAAVSYMESLIGESDIWKSTDAIKNNNYYVLSKELFHYKPNARWAEAYEELAGILYPELFK